MAGGALKLNAVVTSIYAQKPYNWVRTISSAAKPETLRCPVASTPTWRRRIPFPALVRGVPNYQIALGFHNRECSRHLPVRSISTTHMGSDPDKKEQQLPDSAASPPPTSQSDKLLTLPTILTIGRVAAVPLLVSTFYVDSWWGPAATTGIFIAAAITDWLDGYIARKFDALTFSEEIRNCIWGLFWIQWLIRPLDASAFGQMPWLLTVPSIAIIGREITMSAVREWAASQGSKLSEAVAVNNLGKWKTATQMTALTILLATRDSSLVDAGTLVGSGVALLYISAWLAVWSLFVYMRKIWKVLLI